MRLAAGLEEGELDVFDNEQDEEATKVRKAETVYIAYANLGYPTGYIEDKPPLMLADQKMAFHFMLESDHIRIKHVSYFLLICETSELIEFFLDEHWAV